ncbi:MAG: F0F1 ATP synthase subunit delta, partial [Polaromonas sp.]|nr:F0F1 ATP synthase subunit delta [Polaromonas sp.]
MAELATIARPYAEALFKSAAADLSGATVWLDELAAIASNAQLQQYAGNPGVTDAQTFDVITGVAKTPLPDAARNFLRVVIANGRVGVLPEIASQFRALKNARSGSADATVFS